MSFDDRVSSEDPVAGGPQPFWKRNLVWIVFLAVFLLVGGCITYLQLDDSVRVSEFICNQAFEGEIVAETFEEQEKVIEKCIDEGYLPEYFR